MKHICRFLFKTLTLICLLVIPSHLLAVDVPLYLEKYDFTKGSNRPLLTSGWSTAEQTHTWSDGDSATITFTLNPPPVIDFELILDAPAFLFGTHLRQEIDVKINGNAAGTLVYTPESNNNKTFTLPKEWASDGNVRLLLNFKNHKAPVEIGLNVDQRRLGLALKTLYVSTPNIEKTFQGVVTLGDCCFPKIQLDLSLEKRFPGRSQIYSGGGNLFDYMIPRNLSLLADAIASGLTDSCPPTMVVRDFFFHKGLFTALDDKYDMHFLHLLDQHPAGINSHKLTQSLLDKYYPDIEPKITYLKTKFTGNKKKSLYIVSGVHVVEGADLSLIEYFNTSTIRKLRDSIAAMRGDMNFSLLVIYNRNNNFKDEDNIFFRKIPFFTDNIFTPNTDFQKILDEFTFLPCPPKEASGHD